MTVFFQSPPNRTASLGARVIACPPRMNATRWPERSPIGNQWMVLPFRSEDSGYRLRADSTR